MPTSNYDYQENFDIKSAETSTKTMPCTNRPLACPKATCGVVVWSYNLYEHFKFDHVEMEFDFQSPMMVYGASELQVSPLTGDFVEDIGKTHLFDGIILLEYWENTSF